MSASQRGFTLIELVVVILILGILAATALPRFMSAQIDARIAKAKGIYGAVRTAASLAKARCELDLGRALADVGTCGNATPQVNMDGVLVSVVNKYPDAAAAGTGITRAAQLDAANDALTITYGAANTDRMTIDIAGAAALANCRISYTPALPNASPDITLDTSGC